MKIFYEEKKEDEVKEEKVPEVNKFKGLDLKKGLSSLAEQLKKRG